MTVDELIAGLEEFRELHGGTVEVVYLCDYGNQIDVTKIGYLKYPSREAIAILH